MRPLLSAVLIVKDEADTITRTLESCLDCCDWVTILDTGSTDGTQEICRRFFAEKRLPGRVHEEPFQNFAASRNRAFDLNESEPAPVFALVLDGGDVIKNPSGLRRFCLEQREGGDHAYYLDVINDDAIVPQTRLSRVDSRWRYVGAVHEVLMDPTRTEAQGPKISGVSVIRPHSSEGGERRLKRFERDLTLLKREITENPKNDRAQFYLGQTLEGLGHYAKAIQAYRRRAEMGGWDEEVWEAKYRIGLCSQKVGGFSWEKSLQFFLEAFSARPSRAEPLYTIALHYHEADNHALAFTFAVGATTIPYPQGDILNIRRPMYTWGLSYLIGTHAWYLGQYEIGLFHALLAHKNWDGSDPVFRENLIKNVQAYHGFARSFPENWDLSRASTERLMGGSALADHDLSEPDRDPSQPTSGGA